MLICSGGLNTGCCASARVIPPTCARSRASWTVPDGDCCMKPLSCLGAFGWSADCLQGAEVAGDRRGVVRVGDQAVLAVCVCRVPGVVDEAAWPDQVGLDDV